MNLPAAGIVTAAAGDEQPFRPASLMPHDAAAVVVADQAARLALRTNIIPALIKKCLAFVG